MNTALLEHCQKPESFRDRAWEEKFIELLLSAKVSLISDQPQVGPDNWPYLLVKVEQESTEPVANLFQWLCEQGVGLAVNPDKEMPDYILTYGMVWGGFAHGLFFQDQMIAPDKVHPGQVQFQEGKVHAGPPSDEYLPSFVRRIIREFLFQQGVNDPKVLVMSEDEKHYDLVFSLDSLGNPPKEEHKGVAEAIAWFLPDYYSLVLAQEKDLPEFHSL